MEKQKTTEMEKPIPSIEKDVFNTIDDKPDFSFLKNEINTDDISNQNTKILTTFFKQKIPEYIKMHKEKKMELIFWNTTDGKTGLIDFCEKQFHTDINIKSSKLILLDLFNIDKWTIENFISKLRLEWETMNYVLNIKKNEENEENKKLEINKKLIESFDENLINSKEKVIWLSGKTWFLRYWHDNVKGDLYKTLWISSGKFFNFIKGKWGKILEDDVFLKIYEKINPQWITKELFLELAEAEWIDPDIINNLKKEKRK